MKINFGMASWHDLYMIKKSIHSKRNVSERIARYKREIQVRLMPAIAEAIDAEMKRIQLKGKVCKGAVIFSVEIHVEPADLIELKDYNVEKDLQCVLEKNNKKAVRDLLVW